MGLLEIIFIIGFAAWLIGNFGPATSGYRTFGSGYGYNGIGLLLAIFLALAIFHVI